MRRIRAWSLMASTRRWIPDWCRRRSYRTASRSESPQDPPQVCWRSWRTWARPACSSPPRSSQHPPGSRLCGRPSPCRDTDCRCWSCCGSVCSRTPRRSRGSPAGWQGRAISPGGSPSVEKEKTRINEQNMVRTSASGASITTHSCSFRSAAVMSQSNKSDATWEHITDLYWDFYRA